MRLTRSLVAISLLAVAPHASAQTESAEEQLFELNDLLKKETTVASTRALSVRETPGIVTVITREELQSSNARDLLDVLNLVPGFAPALDVEGVVDVGLRGIWGHEGKVLLIIDGIEMNELLYSTNQLGLHYPVDLIDTIEIIRGPGSVRYGGYAELAVINIKTRSGSQLHGADLSTRMGIMQRGEGNKTLSAAAGTSTEALGGASLSVGVSLGRGMRTDRDYVDPLGTVVPMAGRQFLQPLFLDVGGDVHGVKLRYLHDGYRQGEFDAYGISHEQVADMGFTSDAADASYGYKPFAALTITPRLTWQRQTPWEVLDTSLPEYYTKTVQRWRGSLTAAYDVLPELTVTAGLDGYRDRAWINGEPNIGSLTQFNGANEVAYTNIAALAEVQYASFIGNLIGGVRYEHHSKFGSSVVPRLALTKAFDAFHFKLLASRAFRAPGIENINAGLDVKPEHTTVFEGEVGYQFGPHVFASANAFNVIVSDPIVYSFDEATQTEYYKNFSQTGSRGFEVEARVSYRVVTGKLSYSYANTRPNQVDLYDVTDHPELVLGLPAHKLAGQAAVTLYKDLAFEPSGFLVSERFSLEGDGAGGEVLQRVAPRFIANAFLAYTNVAGAPIDVRAGVYNLFDQDLRYIQPYDGGHPSLPAQGREYSVKLAIHLE